MQNFCIYFNIRIYFFHFIYSLFKTLNIKSSILPYILLKYFFFINFFIIFQSHLSPQTKQKPHFCHSLNSLSPPQPAFSSSQTQDSSSLPNPRLSFLFHNYSLLPFQTILYFLSKPKSLSIILHNQIQPIT